MKIIIEYVILENLIIDYFILKNTGSILKEKPKLIFISCLFGSIMALICPLFSLSKIIELLYKIIVASLIICLSFKFKTIKKFCLILSTFVLVTFLYGGGCYAIQCITSKLTLLVLLVVAFVLFIFISKLINYYNKKKNITDFNFDVVLINKGKVVKDKGFLDSGNLLYDPITSKPIVLINFKIFEKLFQNIELNELLLHKIDCEKLNKAHYIKFDTVGKSGSMLVFDIDKLLVKNENLSKISENVSLGLSLSGFEKSFGGNVLLHSAVV